jgi:nucleoside-diphosphate-sugar epimerase
MRILVTGATGFIGSALVTELLDRGHEVAGLTRQKTSAVPDGTVGLRGDLREPPFEEIRAFAPAACVHSAWITTPGIFLEAEENRDWVSWTGAFVERLAEIGVSRHIVLGTCIEYAIGDQPLIEDVTPLRPTTLYASSKAVLRQRLRGSPKMQGRELAWARGRGFSIRMVRASTRIVSAPR